MRRDHLDPLGDRQPRRVRGHEKAAQPLGAGRFAGAREDAVEIGDPAVGDPRLLAVEDPAVAVAPGGHVHVGHVRARARLGQREGGQRLAGAGALQPGALRRRAEQRDRPRSQALHREGEIGQAVMAGQGFADQAQRAHVQRLAGRMAQEAGAAERGGQLDAGRVDVRMIDRGALGARSAISRPRTRVSPSRRRRGRRARSRGSACRSPGPGPRPRSPGRGSCSIPD